MFSKVLKSPFNLDQLGVIAAFQRQLARNSRGGSEGVFRGGSNASGFEHRTETPWGRETDDLNLIAFYQWRSVLVFGIEPACSISHIDPLSRKNRRYGPKHLDFAIIRQVCRESAN